MASQPASARQRPVFPHDLLQHALSQVWRSLLQLEAIEVGQSFFALGGNPKLAERMAAEIEDLCGFRLPPRALSGTVTIERLADLMVDGLTCDGVRLFGAHSCLSVRKPFLFFHGDFNTGGYYVHNLARSMNRPMCSFQAPGLDGLGIPESMDEIVDRYLERALAIQPEGPYYLGGHCAGGLAAYEIARRLTSLGHSVAIVAMIHAQFVTDGRAEMLPPARPSAPPFALSAPVARAWRFRKHATPLLAYRPGCYNGKTIQFWPERGRAWSPDPLGDWRAVAPNIQFQLVPGDHLTCVTSNCAGLVRELRSYLEGAA